MTVAAVSKPRLGTLSFVLFLLLASCARESLAGTDLGGQVAPDFTLVDGGTGERVSLSAQRGRVVLLTFIYTQCPDICPLTAERIRNAADQVSARGGRGTYLAVTVDPAHDTPQAIREFLDAHRLKGTLRYLTGDKPSLAAVWRSYSIDVGPAEVGVAHLDAIILIDKLGRARILLNSDVDPRVIARDIVLLAAE